MSFASRQARSAAISARREGALATYTPVAGGAIETLDLAIDDNAQTINDQTGAWERRPQAFIPVAALGVTPAQGDRIEHLGRSWTVDDWLEESGMWQLTLRHAST